MAMRTIILAAGEGTRLRPKTLDRPKCLVEFAGRPLLDYQLASLREAGLEDITVVTGYLAKSIEARFPSTRHNPRWANTNMVVSLMEAADLLDGATDLLIAYGDIVYEASILSALRRETAPLATSVDLEWEKLWKLRSQDPLADAESLKMDPQGSILELGQKPRTLEEVEGQYMGLIRVGARLAPKLLSLWESLDPQGSWEGRNKDSMFMTTFLQICIGEGYTLKAVPVRGGWFELDTLGDLEVYEKLHCQGNLGSICRLPQIKE